MKTLVKSFIAVLILIVPFIAFAQGKYQMDPEEKAQQMTKHMYAELDLSKDQMKEVEKINLDHATQMDNVYQEMQGLREKKFDEMKKLRTEHEAQLQKVLTEDQYKKLILMQRCNKLPMNRQKDCRNDFRGDRKKGRM
ncbi:MAG: hypothetical protein WC151_12795 [Bacteroidales bacterium]|nr:hypothetical protein [Bacteroidales bacterium]